MPIFWSGRSSLGSFPLHAVTQRDRHAAQITHEASHPVGHERVGVVGALPRVVQREVLLEDPGAEHERDRGHCNAVVMVGETDHEVGVALAERGDDREVQVLDLGRVGGGAVEHAELLVPGHDRLDGAVDVLQRPAARGQEHWFAERRDPSEKRDVEQIPGGELERVDVELGEQVRARLVEGGGDERDALLLRVARQLEPVALRQLEELAVLAVGRAVALLVVVRRVVVVAREERAVVALLELHRIHAALPRRVDQRLRLLELALVVVPDLGDDVRGTVRVSDLPSTTSSGTGRWYSCRRRRTLVALATGARGLMWVGSACGEGMRQAAGSARRSPILGGVGE